MEYETHKAVINWGENIENMLEEKRTEIEQAIKALIEVLDRTNVASITFSKIDEKEENQSGSAASSD